MLLLFGCNKEEKQTVSSTNDTGKISSEEETKEELLTLSKEIFTLLEESDYKKLSEKVDAEHGVTFAFYGDFGNLVGYGGEYVNLSKKEIREANDTKYVWGYDESDKQFELALDEYVQQMLLQRWEREKVEYTTITFNESADTYGGVINTTHQYYPDAKYVEYYSPGENEHSFQLLRFIYQEKDGEWYLIGIARNVATT